MASRSRRSLSVCFYSFFSEKLGSFVALQLVNYLTEWYFFRLEKRGGVEKYNIESS